jgi:hypothetical protein
MGRVAGSASLDAWGGYRLDGLAPGRYQLRLVGADGTVLGQRPLELVDQFVFNQDFTIAQEPPAPGSES